MKFRVGVLAISLSACGCLYPPEIVPVGPPGVELKRMPQLPDEETAQALGETVGQAGGEAPAVELSTEVSPPTKVGEEATTKTGLRYTTLKEGTGAEAKPGQTVQVHYTGTLTTGQKFDSSRDRGQPFKFRLGAGEVIKGWDEGISGMRIGENRKLTIPPEIAYGPSGRPPAIPPNSTLVFDVELVDAK